MILSPKLLITIGLPTLLLSIGVTSQSNPPCYICDGDATATISNPDVLITLPPDLAAVAGVDTLSCQQIFTIGANGLIPAATCDTTSADADLLQEMCGCSNFMPAPVAVPVDAPVAVPIDAPVTAPVTAPVDVPVDAPVTAPVATPVVAPVAVPVVAPVTAPVATPVVAPVAVPVVAPVEVPVDTPVDAPTECDSGKGKGGKGKGGKGKGGKGDESSKGKKGKKDKKCKGKKGKGSKESKTPKAPKKGKGSETSATTTEGTTEIDTPAPTPIEVTALPTSTTGSSRNLRAMY